MRSAVKAHLHTSIRRRWEDQSHQGLFWRALPNKDDTYTLSFLKEPADGRSLTDIGVNTGKELSPRTFEVFEEWMPIVHAILR